MTKNMSRRTDARRILEEESLEEGRGCERRGGLLGEQNEWVFFFFEIFQGVIEDSGRQKFWFRTTFTGSTYFEVIGTWTYTHEQGCSGRAR